MANLSVPNSSDRICYDERKYPIHKTNSDDQIEKLRKRLKPFEAGLAKYNYSLKDLPILDLGDRQITQLIEAEEMNQNRVMIVKEKCNRPALAFFVQKRMDPNETGVLLVYEPWRAEIGINNGWRVLRTSLSGHHRAAKHGAFITDTPVSCTKCPFRHPNFTQGVITDYTYPDQFLESLFKNEDEFYEFPMGQKKNRS